MTRSKSASAYSILLCAVALVFVLCGGSKVGAQEEASDAQDSTRRFAAFELNNVNTILPTRLAIREGDPSVQIISRQATDGAIGYVLNITFQYSFDVPTEDEITEMVGEGRFTIPNTVQYATYVYYATAQGPVVQQSIDAGTTNLSGSLATSLDIEFASSGAVLDFIAAGADISVLTAIEFPQLSSIRPETEEVRQLVVDYLANNIIGVDAPVLSTYEQLATAHPEIVGRNPAQVLSALSSVFDQSRITVDETGEPELQLPPAFNVTINAAFSAPTNIRFVDRTVARVSMNVCESGSFVILEIGATGCENLNRLFERFE